MMIHTVCTINQVFDHRFIIIPQFCIVLSHTSKPGNAQQHSSTGARAVATAPTHPTKGRKLTYAAYICIMGKKQANKDRKATEDAIVAGAKVPRSFVIHRGRVPPSIRILEKDLRQLMMPYTAKALRESDRNVMKDFIAIAGPLNVSHMMCLTHSDSGTSTLRICRFPRGPTLYFNIESYSLCRDIISRQRHPFSPGKAELLHSPLVVLNSMQNADKHVQVPLCSCPALILL
jgi:hypothetical protein